MSFITCVFEMVNIILKVIHHDHIYQYMCVYIFLRLCIFMMVLARDQGYLQLWGRVDLGINRLEKTVKLLVKTCLWYGLNSLIPVKLEVKKSRIVYGTFDICQLEVSLSEKALPVRINKKPFSGLIKRVGNGSYIKASTSQWMKKKLFSGLRRRFKLSAASLSLANNVKHLGLGNFN